VVAARLHSSEVVESQEEIGFCLDGIARDGCYEKGNVRTAVEELLCEAAVQSRKSGNEASQDFCFNHRQERCILIYCG
jgi:hypothetical protein